MKQNNLNVVGSTIKMPYQKPEIQVVELSNAPVLLAGSVKPNIPDMPIKDL